MTLDEAERAEAEAREELWNYARTDERVRGFGDAIKAHAEAVRRTGRLKAEALVRAATDLADYAAKPTIRGEDFVSAYNATLAALAAYQEGVPRG